MKNDARNSIGEERRDSGKTQWPTFSFPGGLPFLPPAAAGQNFSPNLTAILSSHCVYVSIFRTSIKKLFMNAFSIPVSSKKNYLWQVSIRPMYSSPYIHSRETKSSKNRNPSDSENKNSCIKLGLNPWPRTSFPGRLAGSLLWRVYNRRSGATRPQRDREK